MPQTERDAYSGFWVKIRTKYCGTKRDSRNINVVKPMHKKQDAKYNFADALNLSGTHVEADEGLGASGDAEHRRGDEQHVALYDGCAGDESVSVFRTAKMLQDCI